MVKVNHKRKEKTMKITVTVDLENTKMEDLLHVITRLLIKKKMDAQSPTKNEPEK